MAYTVTIERPSCKVCKKRADVRVYNRQNAEQGSYCRKCARAEVLVLERHEMVSRAVEKREQFRGDPEKSEPIPEK